MDQEKGVQMPTLATERTVTSPSLDQQNKDDLWDGDEHLGYRNVPYKEFVDALAFPCSIGTAISAGAAFSILAANSIFGDSSPEAFDQLRHMTTLLAWSAGCYALVVAIVGSFQFLYSLPYFCKVITLKLNYSWERRRHDKPWDLLRSFIAYGTVGCCILALLLQLAGTILLVEALRPFAPVLLTQIPVSFVFVTGMCTFVAVVLMERDDARERMEKV
ncbi:hypothetical protein FRC05_008613, partial [Tulasnella sp. 425]